MRLIEAATPSVPGVEAQNQATAAAALGVLHDLGWVNQAGIAAGLESVPRCRFQVVHSLPRLSSSA
jgi:hypothetical protein